MTFHVNLIVLSLVYVVRGNKAGHTLPADLEALSTPFGGFHPSCVYEWPNGTSIGRDHVTFPNGTVKLVPPCPVKASRATGSYHGWVASAWAYPPGSDDEFTYFSSSFNVPRAPLDSNTQDITYIFNGLEDDASDFILQPVLQFTNYWGGKGTCLPHQNGIWGYRAFAVDSQMNQHCSTWYPVSEGDTVTGIMKKLSEGTWTVWAGKDNSGYSLSVSNVNPQTSAQFALELWYPDQCEAYPLQATTFSGALLQTKSGGTITPKWEPNYDTKAASCGQRVEIESGEVTISSSAFRAKAIVIV